MTKKLAPITYRGTYTPSRDDERISYIDYCRANYESNVYEICPFAEVFKTSENTWSMRIYAPSMPLGNWIHLIKGPEKSLLIDNGYGQGDLKGLCEKITGQEVLCAITHNHGDHSSGSFQWDEVYCHPYCADIVEANFTKVDAETWPTHNFCSRAIGQSYFHIEDIIPYNPNTKIIRLENHAVINLGGDYDIEMIHLGGHAPGLCAFLDKKGRVLYSGDAILESLVPGLGIGIDMSRPRPDRPAIPHQECCDARFFRDQITELAKRIDEWDIVRDGHAAIDTPARVVTDLCDAVNAALEDPFAYTAPVEGLFPGFIMQRGIANCRYSDPKNLIFED